MPVRSRLALASRTVLLNDCFQPADGEKRGDVELQSEQKLTKDLEKLPEIRQGLVDRIKKEIAEGTYMTPEKVREAIAELLRELSGS